jgi:formylglycine-generating enzyme required for sulfatase activity
MNPSKIIAAALCGCFGCSAAVAAVPVVSNVSSQQRAGTKMVDITYDVADADGDSLKIRIEVSSNSGTTYNVPASSLTGAIGDNVTPGTAKQIVWNAGIDWDGEYSAQMRVKVIASDAKGLPGLEWGNEVAAGGFLMGQDGGVEGSGPSRHVNIPWSFWLSKYEIRIDQYCEYLNLALATGKVLRNGSTDAKTAAALFTGAPANALLLNLGDFNDIRWNVNKFEPVTGMSDRPVSVTWYGALAFASFYGYDLPTTAEWEKGARGPNNDDAGEHLNYPWGNAISGGYANYLFSGDPYENYNNPPSSATKTPVGYFNGNQTPFGPNTVNGYGLYDVIGNLSEWTRSLNTTIETYSQQESLSASHNLLDATANRLARGGSMGLGRFDTGKLMLYTREALSTTSYTFQTEFSSAPVAGFRVIRRTTP